MAEVIEFLTVEDRLRAMQILEDEDEGYQSLPPNSRFILSTRAVKILKEKHIRFNILGTLLRKCDEYTPL